MSLRYPIRPVGHAELRAFAQTRCEAFNSSWPVDGLVALDRLVVEPERTLAAFDGDQIAGTTLCYNYELTVPGAVVPAAGVSAVAVLPTHRRRGILTALMTRQLAELRTRGEPVAALFASEAAIYGRFGYGPAVPSQAFTLNCRTARLRPVPPAAPGTDRPSDVADMADISDEDPARRAPGSLPAPHARNDAPVTLRPAEPGHAVREMAAVYDAIRLTRPGMISRSPGWWDMAVADPEFLRHGRSPLRCVIAEDQTGPRGYALYSVTSDWDADGLPTGEIALRELFGADVAAYSALWADMLSRDLVTEVRTRLRPADDPLPHLLTDSRQVRSRISDGLWIRLVDVPAALSLRQYLSPVDLVIDVTDALLPANSGRWHLRAETGQAQAGRPGAATVQSARRAADVSLDVAALGAIYLGGTRPGALAQAGQITEHSPGALTALSAAMWWDPAPWSPVMF